MYVRYIKCQIYFFTFHIQQKKDIVPQLQRKKGKKTIRKESFPNIQFFFIFEMKKNVLKFLRTINI